MDFIRFIPSTNKVQEKGPIHRVAFCARKDWANLERLWSPLRRTYSWGVEVIHLIVGMLFLRSLMVERMLGSFNYGLGVVDVMMKVTTSFPVWSIDSINQY